MKYHGVSGESGQRNPTSLSPWSTQLHVRFLSTFSANNKEQFLIHHMQMHDRPISNEIFAILLERIAVYQGLTIVSPSMNSFSLSSYSRFYVDTTMPMSRWLINKNGLFVISQFTDNDEIFFKRSGFESISNPLLNKFRSNLPNLS